MVAERGGNGYGEGMTTTYRNLEGEECTEEERYASMRIRPPVVTILEVVGVAVVTTYVGLDHAVFWTRVWQLRETRSVVSSTYQLSDIAKAMQAHRVIVDKRMTYDGWLAGPS